MRKVLDSFRNLKIGGVRRAEEDGPRVGPDTSEAGSIHSKRAGTLQRLKDKLPGRERTKRRDVRDIAW